MSVMAMSKPQPATAQGGNRPPLAAAPSLPTDPVQHFLFDGMTWHDFQLFCSALPERHFRLAYDQGRLEIMATGLFHGWLSRLLCYVILVLTEELNLPRRSCGDMTCDREDLDRALQPDECFYLTNSHRVLGKRTLSFDIDPPPDLAVEIEMTQTILDRLAILAALGVPEVWRFNGERLRILRLQAGSYVEVERSRFFPQVPLQELVDYLRQRLDTTEETKLIMEFRSWVRQRIAANWQPAP